MPQTYSKKQFERWEALVRPVPINRSLRIYRHRFGPLNVIPSDTRFCQSSWPKGTIYLASDLETAFIETLVRDTYDNRAKRHLQMGEVTSRGVAEVSSTSPIVMMDLTDDRHKTKGIKDAVITGTNHISGQVFARDMRVHLPYVQGICFPSKQRSGPVNFAVFEEYSHLLRVTRRAPLKRVRQLPGILTKYEIELR